MELATWTSVISRTDTLLFAATFVGQEIGGQFFPKRMGLSARVTASARRRDKVLTIKLLEFLFLCKFSVQESTRYLSGMQMVGI